MFKVGSWLYGKKPTLHESASTQSLNALTEAQDREYQSELNLLGLENSLTLADIYFHYSVCSY